MLLLKVRAGGRSLVFDLKTIRNKLLQVKLASMVHAPTIPLARGGEKIIALA